MDTLIFATNNKNKVFEIRSALGNNFKVVTLEEAGLNIDIPEPHNTLEANATEKSSTIYGLTGKDCFSEDTGLEVEALNGEPGVRSARYAGENASSDNNIEKLLAGLQASQNRNARFRTVISLFLQGKEYQFEGICPGKITFTKTGLNGFGYDPVFIPEGAKKTFAEMNIEEKNIFSHRKKALEKLINYLKS